MKDEKRYEEALALVSEKRISECISLLKGKTSFEEAKLLANLYAYQGDFGKAEKLCRFLLTEKEDADLEKELQVIEGKIAKSYLPLYSLLLEEAKAGKRDNKELAAQTIEDLEGLCPTTNLYAVATLYYLRKQKRRTAKKYYDKLKARDKSHLYVRRLASHFSQHAIETGVCAILAALILIAALAFFFWPKGEVEEPAKEETSMTEVETQKEAASLEEKIEAAKETAPELTKEQQMSLEAAKQAYRSCIQKIRQKDYKAIVEEAPKIDLSKLALYQQKEIRFHLARAYDKLGQKEKALAAYEDYAERAKETPESYRLYLSEVKRRIHKLSK